MDIHDHSIRARNMSAVRASDTKPERRVRSMLFSMGYRFRLQVSRLPGKPDIVLPKYKVAIFVHGCFWHQHEGCPKSKRPATNVEFWNKKLDANIVRDAKDCSLLVDLGWKVIVVWECELRNQDALERRLRSSLVVSS